MGSAGGAVYERQHGRANVRGQRGPGGKEAGQVGVGFGGLGQLASN
jgi:hypothetical protein